MNILNVLAEERKKIALSILLMKPAVFISGIIIYLVLGIMWEFISLIILPLVLLFAESASIFLIVFHFSKKREIELLGGIVFGFVIEFISALIDAFIIGILIILALAGLLGMGGGSTGAHNVGTGIGAILMIGLVVGLFYLIVGRIVAGLFIGFLPGLLGAAAAKYGATRKKPGEK